VELGVTVGDGVAEGVMVVVGVASAVLEGWAVDVVVAGAGVVNIAARGILAT
jgi:hypothetical protein